MNSTKFGERIFTIISLSMHSGRVLAFSVNVLFSCVCCVCQSCTVYGDPRRGLSTVSTWLNLEEEVGKALWRILDVLTCSTTAIFCANIQGPSKSVKKNDWPFERLAE